MVLIKCTNCNKDVAHNSNYCIHCGQPVSEKELKSSFKTFFNKYKKCSKINEIIKKISDSYIIVLTIAALLLIGLIICYFLTGIPLKEESLQDYLIGQNIQVNELDYTISKENIVSFEINSRNPIRNKTDEISGVLTLDFKNATAVYDMTFNLKFNSSNNSWEFENFNNSTIENIEPKIELKDSINDLLQKAEINYNDTIIKLSDGFLKEVTDIYINGNGTKQTVTANLVLSNGISESKVSVVFNPTFNLETGQWNLDSNVLETRIIEQDRLIKDLSIQDKKAFILSAFNSSESYTYHYDSDPYIKSITFNKNNISNIDIINFMEYKDNVIRAEISGKASNGPITKINFSGVVYLKLSLINNGTIKKDINIDSISLESPNLDIIKNDLLQDKIDNKPITVAISDTLVINYENTNHNPFSKSYNGSLTIDDKEINVSIDYSLNYNNNSYEWTLNKITKN